MIARDAGGALLVAMWLGAASSVSAQQAGAPEGPGGVSESGMAQGHASITTRSDVTVSLESVPGTSGARIAVLGRGVTAHIADVRACYAQTINTRPGAHGRMRLRLDVPAAGATATSVLEDAVGEAPLLTCVQRVLATLTLDASLRPASAVVVLDFDNTAAQVAAVVAERQAEADAVAISRESGRPEASGDGNAVHFTVRGAADATDELVADAVRVMRTQVPGLLDCRRRASRRGRNPEGALTLTVGMRSGAAPTATVGAVTVADPLAGRCVAQSISRAHRRPSVSGSVEIEVRFDR